MKIRLLLFILSFLFLGTIFCTLPTKKAYASATTQPWLTGIAVYVKSTTGQAITNATVSITLNGLKSGNYCDSPGKTSGSYTADYNGISSTGYGEYLLGDVCCNINGFTITITAPGYQTTSQSFGPNLMTNNGGYSFGPPFTLPPVDTCTDNSANPRRQCQSGSCVSGWSPKSGYVCSPGTVCCIEDAPTPTPTNTPTPSPTPKAPACGEACVPGGLPCPFNCSECRPGTGGGNTCQPPVVPPTATNTPPPGATATPTIPAGTATPTPPPGATATPTNTPGPTNTPAPTSTPKPTSTPVPTNTPIPTPTPTPDFNNAMCKCDQMKVGQITLGQPIQVEAFAKVEGQDTTKAIVRGMKFRIYEGNASAGRVRELPEKGDQPVTVVEPTTPTLVRYRAEWTANPEIKIGEEYRLVATPDCAVKTAFIQSEQQRVVLAERDENLGFFAQIRNFFAGLFGGGSEPEKDGVQIQEETPGPLSFITNFFAPQQSQETRKQLQLDTFYPAQMEKEACNIMKFKFDFIAP